MLTNLDGEILLAETIRDGHDLGDRDLRRANFVGIAASALELSGSDLREADFSNSTLYWVDLFGADCSDASFRNSNLQGANLKSACFRRANFSGATISYDNLGKASSFAHADLTEAILDSVQMSGTLYDAKTIWPVGFNPLEHGLIWTETGDDWVLDPICHDLSGNS